MGNIYLEKALHFLNEIDAKRRAQLEEYFSTAPAWLFDTLSVEHMEKGKIFIRQGEPAETIYLIGNGIVKISDYRIYGIKYDFMLVRKVYAYGGMEVIIDLDKYQATLETVTDCIVMKIPRAAYKRWLYSDLEAMRRESQLMGEYLLKQGQESRAFLFLQGANRFAYLLINRYKQYADHGLLTLKEDRQELSDYTGLCVKTISRSVKKLKEEGLISVRGNYILVDEKQYERLRDMVAEILAEEV